MIDLNVIEVRWVLFGLVTIRYQPTNPLGNVWAIDRDGKPFAYVHGKNTADLFAAAVTDVPALIAEVRRLRKALTEISENGASLPSEANAEYAGNVLD